jgi:integrase
MAEHVSREDAARLLEQSLARPQQRKAVRHLLSGCLECATIVHEVFVSKGSEAPDYSAVIRRCGLSYVVASGEVQAERKHADIHWPSLKRQPAELRLMMVRDMEVYQTWGIYDKIMGEIRRVSGNDPLEGVDLAHLALAVLDALPAAWYGQSRSSDYRASAFTALGNADVLRLIEEARERGGVCSNRTLALVRGVFQYAVDREELDANPALRIPRRFLYAEKPRERVLAEEEARALWPLFDRLQPAVAAAWRLILLTAQRPGEVLSMRWRDLERDSRGWWWNLPAELTKTNRAHRVPLSSQALAVVEALRPLTGSTEWVFASRADGKRLTWLSHSSARLRGWSGLEHFTPHDLRRTAATWLGACAAGIVVMR